MTTSWQTQAQVMIKRGSSPLDWKIHVQAARLHVRHLVVAHRWTTLWLREAGVNCGVEVDLIYLVEGKLLVLLLKMH